MYSDECCVRLDEEKLSSSLLSEPEENSASWTLSPGSVLTAPSVQALEGQSTGSPGGDMKINILLSSLNFRIYSQLFCFHKNDILNYRHISLWITGKFCWVLFNEAKSKYSTFDMVMIILHIAILF